MALSDAGFILTLSLVPLAMVRPHASTAATGTCVLGLLAVLYSSTVSLAPRLQLKEHPQVKALVEAETLLQSGKFAEFWAATQASPLKEVVEPVPGFADAVRDCMCCYPKPVPTASCGSHLRPCSCFSSHHHCFHHHIHSSVQRAAAGCAECGTCCLSRCLLAFSTAIDLARLHTRPWPCLQPQPSLDASIKVYNLTTDGDMVVMPRNAENTARPKRFEESVSFDRISGMMHVLAQ